MNWQNNNSAQIPPNNIYYPPYYHYGHCHHYPCLPVPGFENFPNLYPQTSPKR